MRWSLVMPEPCHARSLGAPCAVAGVLVPLDGVTRYGYSPAQAERMASVFEHLIESWREEAVWAEKIQLGEARPAQRVKLRQRRPAKRS